MTISYVNKGTFSSGTTSASPGLPASLAAGDLMLLVVETANVAVSTPAGWNVVTSSPVSRGTANTAGGVRLSAFWRIFQTGDTAPAVSAPTADHTSAIIFALRGVDTVTPFDGVTPTTTNAAASTTLTATGLTTATANAVVAHLIGRDEDNSSTNGVTGNPTNANLVFTGFGTNGEIHDQVVNTGSGGGVYISAGRKATAGASGNTTATQVSTAYVGVTVSIRAAYIGTVAATLDGATVAATGTVSSGGGIIGTVNRVLAGATVSATAGVRVAGSANATLAGATVAATGTVAAAGGVNGNANATLAGASVFATADVKAANAWTPAQIASKLLLWFDPNDPSTLTLDPSTGAISQADAKSGAPLSASQSNALYRPRRTYNATSRKWHALFDGNDDALVSATTTWARLGRGAMFVARNDETALANFRYLFDSGEIDVNGTYVPAGQFGPYLAKNEDVAGQFVAGGGREPFFQVAGNAGRNVLQIFGFTQVAGTNSPFNLWNNGFDLGSNTPTNDGNANTTPIAIGRSTAYNPGNGGWLGTIGEAIFFSAEVTAAERQQVEGYLAWKHDTVALLPAGHPYKSSPPTVSGSIGTVAATLAGATVAASAGVRVAGSGSSVLGGATASATTGVRVAGSASAFPAGATVSASTAVRVAASVSSSLAGATVAASGTVASGAGVNGSASFALDGASGAATVVIRVSGSVSPVLGGATVAATTGVRVAGSASAFPDGATASASAGVRVAGSASTFPDGASASASAGVRVAASVAASLSGATVAATGSVVSGTVGNVLATLDGASVAASGGVRVAGSATVGLQGVASAISGAVRVSGTATATLSPATLQSTGSVRVAATASATFDGATLSASGSVVSGIVANVNSTLAGATVSASGSIRVAATATLSLAGASSAASASVAVVATVSAFLAPVTLLSSATTVSSVLGSVTATLSGATASASAGVRVGATVATELSGATVASSASVSVGATATATLAGATSTGVTLVLIRGNAAASLEGARVAASAGAFSGLNATIAATLRGASLLSFATITGESSFRSPTHDLRSSRNAFAFVRRSSGAGDHPRRNSPTSPRRPSRR